MNSTSTLVEHFFRHEYGRIVAVLARSLGVRRLELIEDVVQSALSRALVAWPRSGAPDDPSGWLYRTAKNLAIDALRRESTATRLLSTSGAVSKPSCDTAGDSIKFDEEVGDEPLRLLFLCCHPAIPAESRVALALKTVSGFSAREIAKGLLTTTANAEKRIARAKERLRDNSLELIELSNLEVHDRLNSVLSTIYLIFNEGFAASHGPQAIRHDLCEEAIRLARMMANHPLCNAPETFALLALFLFHAARFDSRLDAQGCVVLLPEQDRSQWNWEQVREAMDWMRLSAIGDHLSRYHIETAITWEHCRASDFDSVDWRQVTCLYQMLNDRFSTPMVRLNHAIAMSYSVNVNHGLERLLAIPDEDRRCLRPWWDCAMAQLHRRAENPQQAMSHWKDALALATCDAHKSFILSQIASGTIE